MKWKNNESYFATIVLAYEYILPKTQQISPGLSFIFKKNTLI